MEVEIEEILGPGGLPDPFPTVIATVVIGAVLGGQFVPSVRAMAMGSSFKTRDDARVEALWLLMGKLAEEERSLNDKWHKALKKGKKRAQEYKDARDEYGKFYDCVRDKWISLRG